MDYLAYLRDDADRLLTAAERDLSANVSGCPDWNVGDLVYHIGGVHHAWAAVAAHGWQESPRQSGYEAPGRPADDDVIAWARDQADRLVEVIAGLDPAMPLWNWTRGPQVAAFVPRRMAQETAVHRWDAQAATGTPDAIDAELGADGIDELLTLFLPVSGTYDGPEGASMRLTASDRDAVWTVTLTGPVPPVHSGGTGPVDLNVSGPAGQLLLLLWGRSADGVELDGDPAPLDALRGHLDTE